MTFDQKCAQPLKDVFVTKRMSLLFKLAFNTLLQEAGKQTYTYFQFGRMRKGLSD